MAMISGAQWRVVRKHVEGLAVHDLGAGMCEHSLKLLELGAASVVAIDKERMPHVRDRRVSKLQVYFDQYDGEIDVAFLSSPINKPEPGLLRILRGARKIVYVGKNTDATMCAWPGFFHEMSKRRVLDYVPERPNTLIVYGDLLAHPRTKLRGEERAGLTAFSGDECLSFEEAERA